LPAKTLFANQQEQLIWLSYSRATYKMIEKSMGVSPTTIAKYFKTRIWPELRIEFITIDLKRLGIENSAFWELGLSNEKNGNPKTNFTIKEYFSMLVELDASIPVAEAIMAIFSRPSDSEIKQGAKDNSDLYNLDSTLTEMLSINEEESVEDFLNDIVKGERDLNGFDLDTPAKETEYHNTIISEKKVEVEIPVVHKTVVETLNVKTTTGTINPTQRAKLIHTQMLLLHTDFTRINLENRFFIPEIMVLGLEKMILESNKMLNLMEKTNYFKPKSEIRPEVDYMAKIKGETMKDAEDIAEIVKKEKALLDKEAKEKELKKIV
jgi:hypothetical protein